MNAVPLPDLVPGSEPWMKLMTASKVAAVLGLSPWESRYSLWHRMAGLLPAQEETDQTRRGHYLEGAVINWWQDQNRDEWEVIAAKSYAHPDRPWQAATPDGLLLPHSVYVSSDAMWEPEGVLEVKTAAYDDEWGEAGSDQIPPYYRAQVMWQLDTLGLPVAYVAVLLPRLEFREYRIEYNPAEAAELVAEARAFLDSLPGGPAEERPNLDGHAETYAAVKALHPEIDPRDEPVPAPLAREFCEAKKGLEAAKNRWALALTRMADHMGTAKTAVYLPDPADPSTRIKLADRRAKNGGTPYVQAADAKRLPEIGEAS